MVERYSLTPARARCLLAIERLSVGAGFPPTIRELAAELGGCSPNAVHELVHLLERGGYLTRCKRQARTMQITAVGREALSIARTLQYWEVMPDG